MPKTDYICRAQPPTGELHSPLQRSILAQSERLQLLRLASRVAGINNEKLQDLTRTNPDLIADWIISLSEQRDKAKNEMKAFEAALKQLHSAKTSIHPIAA